MKECARCWTPYDWKQSSSALKMTYCSIFCEKSHLGFTIESIEKPFMRLSPIDYSAFTADLSEDGIPAPEPTPEPAPERTLQDDLDEFYGDGAWLFGL